MKLFDLSIPIIVLMAASTYSLSTGDMRTALDTTHQQYKEQGYVVKPRLKRIRNAYPSLNSLSTRGAQISRFAAWAWRKGYRGHVVVATGPIIVGPLRYLAGMTISGQCRRDSVSVANITAVSDTVLPRLYTSGTVISHELGHQHGLYHQWPSSEAIYGCSIMNADAGRCATLGPVHFTPVEGALIRECICKSICKPNDSGCYVTKCF